MQALAAEIAELVHKLDDQKQPKPLLLNDIRGQISGLKQAVNGLPDQAVAGVAVAKAALEKLNHDLLARERTDKEKVDKLLEQVAAMKEAPETRNSNDPIAVLHTQIAKAKSDIAQLEQKINEAKASVKFTEHKQALEASLTDLNGIKQAWESLERKLPEIIKLHKRIDNATTKNLPNQAAAKQLPLYEELSSEVKQLQGELTQVQEVASTEARRLLESDQAHLDQFNQADQKMLSDIHKEIAVMEDNPSGASQDGIKKLQAQIQKGIATANFGETQQKLAKELTSRLDRVQTTLSQNLVALQNLNPEIVALEQFVNHYEKPGPKDRKDDEALPQYQEQLQKVAGLQAQLRELSLHPEEQENKAALQRLNDIERRLSVLKQNENEDAELQSMNDAFSKQVDAMIEAQRIPDPNDLNTLQQNMRKAVVFQETYNLLHPAHTLENAKQKWVELDEKISQPLLQLQTEISAIKDAKQGLLPLPSYVALAEKLNSLQAEFSQINGENLGAVKAAQKMLNSLYEQLTMLVEQEQELVRLYSERIRFMETPGKIFTQENIQNLRLRITAAKDQAKFKEIKEALENGLARLDQVEATLNNSAQKLGELNNAILALENSLRQWEAQPQNRPGNFELAEEKIFQEVERLKTELKQLPVHKAATLDRLLTVQQGLESLKFRDHQKLSTLSQELGKMGELTNLADIQALKQDIRAAQANAVFKEVHEELEKLLANVTRLETDWQNIPRKLNKISTRIHELHIEMDIRAHTPANQEVKLPSYENLKQELRKLGGDLNQLRVAKKMHLLLAQEDARLQQFHEEDGAIVLEMSHKLRAIEANPNCTQADINILREDISKAKAIVKFSEAHKELQKQSTHLESVQANLDQHISRLLSVAQDLTEEVNALGDKEERKEEAIKEPSDFPSYRQLKDRISALKTELLRLSPEHAKVQQAVVELETIQRTLQSLLEQDQGVKTPLWQTFQSWLSSSEEDQKATTESLQSSIRMQQQKVIFRETFEYLNNLMSIETQVPPTHAHHATSYTNMAGTIGGPNQQQLPGFAQAAGEAAAAINQHEASENEDISAHIADAGGLFGDDDASKVAEAAFKPS
jgi:chromosome segregation ATPase